MDWEDNSEQQKMAAPLDTLNDVSDKILRVLEFRRIKSLPDNVYPKKIYGYQLYVGRLEVTGIAKCKFEAKQFAARYMLILLAKKGYPVPPPHGFEDEPNASPEEYTNATLLREFCIKHQLDLSFGLVGEVDSHPPPTQYTVNVRVGQAERRVTAPTRKKAQDQVAKLMIDYLQLLYGDITMETLSTDDDDHASRSKRRRLDANPTSSNAGFLNHLN